MKFVRLQNLLILCISIFLSSCTGSIHKAYEGDLVDITDVIFVTTTNEGCIYALDGKRFKSMVPGFTLCLQNIELAVPQAYTILAWNANNPATSNNTDIVQFNAEAGKLYKVYKDRQASSRRDLKYAVMEVTDPEEIKTFHGKIEKGKLKRHFPESATGN